MPVYFWAYSAPTSVKDETMRRSALPIILIVLSLLVAMFVGALVNIVTGRIPPDAPYLPYAFPTLGVAVLASIGLAIWQYRLDHPGASKEPPLLRLRWWISP